MTWRLKQLRGEGWVREIYRGRPNVTGFEHEAWEWDTKLEAATAASDLDGGWIPVETAPGRWMYGDPGTPILGRQMPPSRPAGGPGDGGG